MGGSLPNPVTAELEFDKNTTLLIGVENGADLAVFGNSDFHCCDQSKAQAGLTARSRSHRGITSDRPAICFLLTPPPRTEES